MQSTKYLLLAFALGLGQTAFAHTDDPGAGPNGGQIRDAGKYHLELVVKNNALSLYVTDDKDKKVAIKGGSAAATVLSGTTKTSVKLEPAGENMLAGTGKFDIAPGMKIVVSLSLPGSAPLQARFTPPEKAQAADKPGSGKR